MWRYGISQYASVGLRGRITVKSKAEFIMAVVGTRFLLPIANQPFKLMHFYRAKVRVREQADLCLRPYIITK